MEVLIANFKAILYMYICMLVEVGVKRMNITPYDIIGQRYTGPWISNNAFQTSVEFGDEIPATPLDAESRLHDTGVKHWNDPLYQLAVDDVYYEDTLDIPGNYASLARNLVLYGNFANRTRPKILDMIPNPVNFAKIIYKAYENNKLIYDYANQSDQLKKEVREYYRTKDPHPELQRKWKVGGVNNTKMNFFAPYIFKDTFDKAVKTNGDKAIGQSAINDQGNLRGSIEAPYNPYKNLPKEAVVYNPKPQEVEDRTNLPLRYGMFDSRNYLENKTRYRRNRRKKKYVNTVYCM